MATPDDTAAYARDIAARMRGHGVDDIADSLCQWADRWEGSAPVEKNEIPAYRPEGETLMQSDIEIPIPLELWEDFTDDAPQSVERLLRWLTWLNGDGGMQ